MLRHTVNAPFLDTGMDNYEWLLALEDAAIHFNQPITTCIAEKLCFRFQRSNTQLGLLGSLLVRTSLILFAANEESKYQHGSKLIRQTKTECLVIVTIFGTA